MRTIAWIVGGALLLTGGCFFAGVSSAFRHADYIGAGLLAPFGCVFLFGGIYLIKRVEGE